ncbi:hypothetical protein HK102_007613 [Quaeritorhiza haematococci]|nr:hypothetical protein HK102_007613 [Quaeritorhiza haematococci]
MRKPAELKAWEEAILNLSKQYDRVEAMARSDEENGSAARQQLLSTSTSVTSTIRTKRSNQNLTTTITTKTSLSASASASGPILPLSSSKAGLDPASKAVRFAEPVVSKDTGVDDDLEALDGGEMLQMQRRIMEDQDTQLDALGEAISRQKELGLMITDELDLQVELLEQTEDAVDNASSRIRGAGRRLNNIANNSNATDSGAALIINEDLKSGGGGGTILNYNTVTGHYASIPRPENEPPPFRMLPYGQLLRKGKRHIENAAPAPTQRPKQLHHFKETMVNQINKKRINLPKQRRLRKKAFKASTKTLPSNRVSSLNAQQEQDADLSTSTKSQATKSQVFLKLQPSAADDMIDTAEPELDTNSEESTSHKLLGVRAAKMGKNNRLIKPCALSKKKLKLIEKALKRSQARSLASQTTASVDESDVLMRDVTAAKSRSNNATGMDIM